MRCKFSLFESTVGILRLTTVLTLSAIVLILLYAFADIPPYLSFGKGQKFGLLDFSKGIPVDVKIESGYMPDSTIFDSTGIYYGSNSFFSLPAKHNVSRDTVLTNYLVFGWTSSYDNKPGSPVYIAEGRLLTGVLSIKARSVGWRLLLLLPMILSASLVAFGAWQIAGLLRDILSGHAFIHTNHRRIRTLGLAVIVYQLILFILLFLASYWSIMINFISTRLQYHSPLQLTVRLQYDFSFAWLIGGSILLIVAYAFEKGNSLQAEQDLTI